MLGFATATLNSTVFRSGTVEIIHNKSCSHHVCLYSIDGFTWLYFTQSTNCTHCPCKKNKTNLKWLPLFKTRPKTMYYIQHIFIEAWEKKKKSGLLWCLLGKILFQQEVKKTHRHTQKTNKKGLTHSKMSRYRIGAVRFIFSPPLTISGGKLAQHCYKGTSGKLFSCIFHVLPHYRKGNMPIREQTSAKNQTTGEIIKI